MMSPYLTITAVRESAQVERCHTIPHIGSYSVGQHCYGALSLLLLLHDNPSLALIKAVAFHDVPERWSGDVPSPGKTCAIAEAFSIAEDEILEKLGLRFDLLKNEARWLKLVDVLDLWLWEIEQRALGNTIPQEIVDRCGKWLRLQELPERVDEFIRRVRTERGHTPRLSSVFADLAVV